MEKALYTTSLKNFPKDAGTYRRVYFGAEFCQWRVPTPASVVKAYTRARDAGLGFTLMTPWVTGKGLAGLVRIFSALAEASDGYGVEVVVNDFGVLSVLSVRYTNFEPVIGRLLARQKRCPRIPGIMGSLPDAGRDVYLHAGIEDKVTAKYLRGFGIKRAELDSPLQGVGVDLKAAKLRGSIYTPYAYVTVTRHCPASFDGNTWQAFTGCKLKGCLDNVITLENPAHENPLVMRGNAQFVHNPEMPRGLSGMGIDRVVVMEDVP